MARLPEDLATVESFMPLYTRKVVQLGYTCKLLSPTDSISESDTDEKKVWSSGGRYLTQTS